MEKNQTLNKKFKMNWTLILTMLGVIAAWVPFLYDRFNPLEIKGKLISQYDNVGEFKNEPKSLFLFKLSIVALNQSFDLKDIDLRINYMKSGWIRTSSFNQRRTYFTYDNKVRKLNLSESAFLNNLTILKKDEPVVGYIFTTTPVFPDDKITEIVFVFKSYDGAEKSLSFNTVNIDESKMLFDDSIWELTDSITR
jgi:hypothetical protein